MDKQLVIGSFEEMIPKLQQWAISQTISIPDTNEGCFEQIL